MANRVNINEWAQAQEPIARKAFALTLGRNPADLVRRFHNPISSNKLTETYFNAGDIGTMPEWNGRVPYDTWSQEYEHRITNSFFSKGLMIDYIFIRTDQQNIVEDGSKMLGLAAARRIAGDSVAWFNSGASAMTCRDGQPLFGSHTSGVDSNIVQSNMILTSFSAAALQAAKIKQKQFLSNRGNELDIMPNMLIGSNNLEQSFYVTVKSQKVPESANNAANIHYGKWETVNDVRITDPYAWAIVDKELMLADGPVWQVLDDVTYERDKDFDTRSVKYAAHMAYGKGVRGWEFVLYSQAAS